TERDTVRLPEIEVAALCGGDGKRARDGLTEAVGKLGKRTGPIFINNKETRWPACDADVARGLGEHRAELVRVVGGDLGPPPGRVLPALTVAGGGGVEPRTGGERGVIARVQVQAERL